MHIIQVLYFTISVYINQSPRDIFAKTAYLQKRPNDVIYEREQTLKIKMFTFISNKFNHKTQGTKGRKSEGIRGSQRINEYGNSVRLRQPRHGVRASICEIEYQGAEVRYRGNEDYQVGDEVTLTL